MSSSPADSFDVDVLIVGAGPVGMALATELALRGRTSHIVERADRVGRQPRAKTTNVRSMEHMRRWGLAEAIRAASPLPATFANRVVFATGIDGRAITAFENVMDANRARNPLYPESGQWIPQYEVERVLLGRVLSDRHSDISFGRSFLSYEADADGVTATIADPAGGESTMRARYLVGADGARSKVRDLLGARMQGDGRIAQFLTLVLRVPGLSKRIRHGDALMYWLVNPQSPCTIGPMDTDDTWFWGTMVPPGSAPDAESNAERVRRSLGDDMPFEILVTDLWSAMRLQADTYGRDRVFLAGDACHLHPPFGGFGMNLGIADAVDLGWKLAARLDGWGGAKLLDSYEAERRPVHARVIDAAVENMALLSQHFLNPALEAAGEEGDVACAAAATAIQAAKSPEFHSLGVVLGYGYAGSPIIVADGSPAPEPTVVTYQPSACPGYLAPHAWFDDGSSLYDHFGKDFTLLQTERVSAATIAAITAAAAAEKVPLKHVVAIDPKLRALYQADLAIVRPDQHVAWRGNDGAAGGLMAILRGAN